MFHKQIIKDGDVTKVVKEILVDGQEYVDEKPREGSVNSVTSGGVAEALGDASDILQEQIDDIAEKAGSGYTPKGPASVATLNGLTGQENGWLYTMTDAGTLTDGSLAVTAGDTVAWDEANSVWYKAMDYAPRASVEFWQKQNLTNRFNVATAGSVGDTLTLTLNYNSGWSCAIIDCHAGDVFEVAGIGGSNPRLWCFVDASNKIISVGASNLSVTTPRRVTASVDGKFIYNTANVASVKICNKKIPLVEQVEELSEPKEVFLLPKMADIGVTLDAFDVSDELENFTLFDGTNNPAMSQIYDYLDDVISEHPGLISKHDAAEEMGLAYPEYAADYKTYMYKISNTNSYAGNGTGQIFEKKKIFLFGGVHGLEIAGCVNLAIFAKRLCSNITEDSNLFKLLSAFDFYIVPCVNGYGIINGTYENANGVNINRNYPTFGWTSGGTGSEYTGPTAGSEFETQLVMALINDIRPNLAIDCHSYSNHAWQFYSVTAIPDIRPILYQILAECSFVFKKAFPQYFGTEFSLLKNAGGNAPANADVNNGRFSTWYPENYSNIGITMEVSDNINYLDGEPITGKQEQYSATVFSVANFTIRDFLGRLGDYVLKNNL